MSATVQGPDPRQQAGGGRPQLGASATAGPEHTVPSHGTGLQAARSAHSLSILSSRGGRGQNSANQSSRVSCTSGLTEVRSKVQVASHHRKWLTCGPRGRPGYEDLK